MELDEQTLQAHRPALLGHCYRMLGSPFDADDAVQDTFVRALRGRFEGRSSLRTWLMSIATRVCLDELSRRKRRAMPDEDPPGSVAGPFDALPAAHWVEPLPDALVENRSQVRLALVAALQVLPPNQRAALLLTEVAGCTAQEAADALETSVASINSAVQRARTKLPTQPPTAPVPEVAQRYLAAFEAFDLDALSQLLAQDVHFTMPPIALWVRGIADVRAFLAGPGHECEGSVLVPVQANGELAFAQYRHGGATPWGLVTLELQGERIARITTFLDVDRLFPLFQLPNRWPRENLHADR